MKVAIAKFLVEIGNLTFNLVNKGISQNSKLKLKGKVMDRLSKLNLIRKNKSHHHVNL